MMKQKTSKTPTADESAKILTAHLKLHDPFFFVRYGDGALECIYDEGYSIAGTCDGEVYTRDLGLALLAAWARLEASSGPVYAGDWQSASFGGGSGHNREEERWAALTDGSPFIWVHFEALLLMRESPELIDFYRTVRGDPRRKVYIGPLKNRNAAAFLGARHVVTPMVPDLINQVPAVVEILERHDFEVCLYGAGMAGNVIAVESWARHPDRTYISLGSALDPLFGAKTRTQQLPRARLERLFREML
jgi:hypothetical protein